MRALLAAGLAVFLGTASLAQRPEAPALTVSVQRDGPVWTADLVLPRQAKAWVFARAGLTEQGSRPWRQPHWTIETPGVRLERRGFYDALIGEDGRPVPARVRIRFTPPPERLAGEYDPALVFTDGAVALFSQQFDAYPTDDVAGSQFLYGLACYGGFGSIQQKADIGPGRLQKLPFFNGIHQGFVQCIHAGGIVHHAPCLTIALSIMA